MSIHASRRVRRSRHIAAITSSVIASATKTYNGSSRNQLFSVPMGCILVNDSRELKFYA